MLQLVGAHKLCAGAFMNGHGVPQKHVSHPMFRRPRVDHTGSAAQLPSQVMVVGNEKFESNHDVYTVQPPPPPLRARKRTKTKKGWAASPLTSFKFFSPTLGWYMTPSKQIVSSRLVFALLNWTGHSVLITSHLGTWPNNQNLHIPFGQSFGLAHINHNPCHLKN